MVFSVNFGYRDRNSDFWLTERLICDLYSLFSSMSGSDLSQKNLFKSLLNLFFFCVYLRGILPSHFHAKRHQVLIRNKIFHESDTSPLTVFSKHISCKFVFFVILPFTYISILLCFGSLL